MRREESLGQGVANTWESRQAMLVVLAMVQVFHRADLQYPRPAPIGVAGLSPELAPKPGFLNLFGHNGPLARPF